MGKGEPNKRMIHKAKRSDSPHPERVGQGRFSVALLEPVFPAHRLKCPRAFGAGNSDALPEIVKTKT